MKFEYDLNLYKTIANFDLNEFVQVSSRKGGRRTIHITNITKLSWHELQFLVPNGSDMFSKMVLLYQQCSGQKWPCEPAIKAGAHSSGQEKTD